MDAPTGTTALTALDKLIDWLPLYETQTNRFMFLIGRQQKIFHQWCDALKFPTESFEHQFMIQKLYEEMIELQKDVNETLVDLGDDFYLLKDVFSTSRNEMMKMAKEENVSKPRITKT